MVPFAAECPLPCFVDISRLNFTSSPARHLPFPDFGFQPQLSAIG
jgi:hypothetical protein